jgi:hypothetical protein
VTRRTFAPLEAIRLIRTRLSVRAARATATTTGVWAIVGISPWRPRFDPKADTLAIAEYSVGDKNASCKPHRAIPKGTPRKIWLDSHQHVLEHRRSAVLARTQGAGATNLDAAAELKKDPALAPS